ncbi:MAG TPA: hypothetical protein VKA83_09310 [Methylomirabilota bacterium]|nr:hypothetical protein [Methylomirabilota bacterium]
MFTLSIPLLIALVSFALGIVRFVWTTFFSKNAKVEAAHEYLVRKKAQLEAERDRLRAALDRIQKEPKKTGQDLEDDLNQKWNK